MELEKIYSDKSDLIQEMLNVDQGGHVYGEYSDYRFHSVFQPIFDRNMCIFGFECLARISSIEGYRIDPSLFFSSFESHSDCDIVYSLLCGKVHMMNFANSKFNHLRLFINVAPSVFNLLSNNEPAIERFNERLDYLNLTGSQIIYELLEFYEKDITGIVQGKKALLEHGIQIAIDDYGSQCSTKDRVIMVQPSYLK
ncbi:EAL domain-containing protein, partial [Vibrio makurazakiensis]|uniref:EAL domain-containing protein n=1 Tax=Vibrio makurazakiensis TaxID=2910250 RepID=UPI003D101605